jgi:hypothetical protein
MGIIKDILKEELDRLEDLAMRYQQILDDLPKGSISVKKRHNNFFVYRAYRIKDKVKFDYIGKESSPAVALAREQLKKRRKYVTLLKKVKDNIKEIKRS